MGSMWGFIFKNRSEYQAGDAPSIQPVFDLEPFDPSEFSGVVGHQDGIQTQRMGADLRIQRIDRPSGVFKVCPHRTVSGRGVFVEIDNLQGQQEFLQGLPVPFDVPALGYPIAQLSQSNHRDADVPRGQTLEASQGLQRFSLDDGDADIGIEHISHQNSSRF